MTGTKTEDLPSEFSLSELWKNQLKLQEQLIAFQQQQLSFQKDTAEKLQGIHDILSQAKGGWKIFLIAGGTVAGVVAVFDRFFGIHLTLK